MYILCRTPPKNVRAIPTLTSFAKVKIYFQTSNAVASTLYQLSLRPNVQEKIYNEVTKVLQGRSMKPGDVNQMPYLKACVKEVLR